MQILLNLVSFPTNSYFCNFVNIFSVPYCDNLKCQSKVEEFSNSILPNKNGHFLHKEKKQAILKRKFEKKESVLVEKSLRNAKTILTNFLQLNKKIVFSEKGKKSVIINNIQYSSLFQLVKFLFSETKVNLSLVFMYKLKQLCKLFNSKQKAKLSNQAKNMFF